MKLKSDFRMKRVKSYKKNFPELGSNSLITRFPHKKNACANPTYESETKKNPNQNPDVLSVSEGHKKWICYLF